MLRFYLPSDCLCLDIPVGSYVQIRAVVGGEKLIRNYTPTSIGTDEGFFDLVVKRHTQGKVSSFLHELQPGNTLDVRGPSGRFRYARNMYHTLCMICGGSGITPILQILKTVLNDATDKTNVYLLFANHVEEEIICKEELDELLKIHSTRFFVQYMVTEAASDYENIKRGRIGVDVVKRFLPVPSEGIQALVCGTTGFCKSMQGFLSDAMFTREMIYIF